MRRILNKLLWKADFGMKKSVILPFLILLLIVLLMLYFGVGKRDEALFPQNENNIESTEVLADENSDLYILTLEGERLNLYLGKDKTAPFESEIVSKEVFPKTDIAILKQGMVFENKEDAYSAMENFIN